MVERLITVATFAHPEISRAHLAKVRLEAEGIYVSLVDEHTESLFPGIGGGIKLQVREADAQKATEILGEEPQITESLQDELSDEDDETCCPECKSVDVDSNNFWRWFAFNSSLAASAVLWLRTGTWYWLLLVIPAFFVKARWECRECGHQWKA